MPKRISAAVAKAHFAALLAQVAQGGEPIIIERHGKPQGALVSLEDLPFLGDGKEAPQPGHWALALVGAWQGVPDKEVDALVREIYAQRALDRGRPVSIEG